MQWKVSKTPFKEKASQPAGMSMLVSFLIELCKCMHSGRGLYNLVVSGKPMWAGHVCVRDTLTKTLKCQTMALSCKAQRYRVEEMCHISQIQGVCPMRLTAIKCNNSTIHTS